jgi:hypothetical protein
MERDNIEFETAELRVEKNISEELLDRIDDIEWSSMEWEKGESNVTQNISEEGLDMFGYDAEWNGMEWEIVEMNEEHNSCEEVMDMYGNDAELSSMEFVSHIPKNMLNFVGNCGANPSPPFLYDNLGGEILVLYSNKYITGFYTEAPILFLYVLYFPPPTS